MTVQYPLFKDVVNSYTNLFYNVAPSEVDFDTFKDNIVRHYKWCEINYYIGEFVDRFNEELRRQVPYFDHCVKTSKLKYDVLNYNKNESTTTTTSKTTNESNNVSRFQDTPVNAVSNTDNYNTNVTKSKGDSDTNNSGSSTTVYYHQSELRSNQDFIKQEYEVYKNPYELLYRKLDYLFMEVY